MFPPLILDFNSAPFTSILDIYFWMQFQTFLYLFCLSFKYGGNSLSLSRFCQWNTITKTSHWDDNSLCTWQDYISTRYLTLSLRQLWHLFPFSIFLYVIKLMDFAHLLYFLYQNQRNWSGTSILNSLSYCGKLMKKMSINLYFYILTLSVISSHIFRFSMCFIRVQNAYLKFFICLIYVFISSCNFDLKYSVSC